MSVVETGYQSYQIWNMYNEGSNAGEMAQINVSSSNSHQVVASSGDTQVTLQGNFSNVGANLATVTGTITDLSVSKNGAVLFTDHYSAGADWQNVISNFDYNLGLLSGNDRFTGSATQNINDMVQAMDGNDVFTGYGDANGYNGSNGDQFYGGNGIDTAVYRGSHDQYAIQDTYLPDHRGQSYQSTPATTVTDMVANRDGLDKLFDVERLQFSDTSLAFDTGAGEHAGSAYRLYKAAFDRAPDEGGVGYWINRLDNGADLTRDVAQSFINSQEFQQTYGPNISNNAFITLLYNNVLDRDPDQGGLAFWNQQMNGGMSRANVLANFSESAENISNTADLIANGIQYDMWVG